MAHAERRYVVVRLGEEVALCWSKTAAREIVAALKLYDGQPQSNDVTMAENCFEFDIGSSVALTHPMSDHDGVVLQVISRWERDGVRHYCVEHDGKVLVFPESKLWSVG